LDLKKNQTGTVTLTIPTGSLEVRSYSFSVQASAPALKRQAASTWTSTLISLSVTPATNDITPPVTALTITSGISGSDGWYKSDVGIRLTATNSGGTGVKEVHYILNSGSEVRTDGNVVEVTIGTEGPHVLRYWAFDNAGNVETENYGIIREIRVLNENAEIIVMTLYNPYNSDKITGYDNDPVLRLQAEVYISRINGKITGVDDAHYRVIDIELWGSRENG
jgi:hypothetical protein